MKNARLVFSVSLVAAMGWAARVQAQAMDPDARAMEQKVVKARPLPLEAVRITGGPLKAAQDADGAFLITIEPDRALSALRTAAGLAPRAQPLGGWDSAVGRQLTGHIAGHLLSALSLMYAATGDDRYKKQANHMVSELAAIQTAQGDGYIGAQQDAQRKPEKDIFKQVAAGTLTANYESLNGLWSPWYVQHKMFAGLRDAYRHTGNKQALEAEKKLAGWARETLKGLSEAQIQQMLEGEFGGMGEVLVDLYADTGDKQWLELSYKFEHESFIAPLVAGQDKLGNVHGNHNIPTLMGSAVRYQYAGKPQDLAAADFFWKTVVDHHTFATGGDSGAQDGEFFPYADRLAAMIKAAPGAATNESCNVYNMLKLTRVLFSFEPDAAYADFLERATFNHALTQINPANGLMSYHVPVGEGVRKDLQGSPANPNSSFTCCVGTGMENPALYADGMYYEAGDKLWVNFYAPSTVNWAPAGTQLTMDSDMPEGETAKLTLTLKEPKALTLELRRPAWTTAEFEVLVNGEAVALPAVPLEQKGVRLPASTYVEIARTWKTGDHVELTVPKDLRLERTPDDPTLAAVMWGPLVLAADQGTAAPPAQARGRRGAAAGAPPAPNNNPVIVTAARSIAEWLKPAVGKAGEFSVAGAGRTTASPAAAVDVSFVPLYRLHDHTYSVYLNMLTPEAWSQRTGGTQ